MSVDTGCYARALLDFLYPSKAEMGRAQLRSFLFVLSAEDGARLIFENPTLSESYREELLDRLAPNLDSAIRSFLNLLINGNYLNSLEEIVIAYENLLDAKLREARVAAAGAFDSKQGEAISARLQALAGK